MIKKSKINESYRIIYIFYKKIKIMNIFFLKYLLWIMNNYNPIFYFLINDLIIGMANGINLILYLWYVDMNFFILMLNLIKELLFKFFIIWFK